MEYLGDLFSIPRDDGETAAYVYIVIDKIEVYGFDYGYAFMTEVYNGAKMLLDGLS